jgi:hypothetical protein
LWFRIQGVVILWFYDFMILWFYHVVVVIWILYHKMMRLHEHEPWGNLRTPPPISLTPPPSGPVYVYKQAV